ncbi:MAG: tRNA lysidine(34) synthetase TilS [Candidatus Omnitrophica bacterium]|nr:tRNA lysidine(34) synthetase TilS [Candidatus Omnitrophota bacterium]
MKTFPKKFEENLKQQKLILPREKVFIAVSGGPDSVALFHLLHGLENKKWKLKLGILHFNHQMRGRHSDRDEAFVRKLAKKFKVPFISGRQKVSLRAAEESESLEEAARNLRYDFFKKSALRFKIKKIVLGHTMDDQAETVLMRVLQGTGLRGLAGIRPCLQGGKVVFVRPLLDFSKKEILAYLRFHKIFYQKDESNQSPRFLRNRIRRKLLPMLGREFNPRVMQALARIPPIVSEEIEILENLAEETWRRTFKTATRLQVELRRMRFLKAPAPLQFRMIEKALKRLDPKSGVNFETWQRLKPNLVRSRFRHSFPRDIDFSLTPQRVLIYKKSARS